MMITLDKYYDLIINQVDIKRAPLIFISFGCLLLLACFLYVIKPGIDNYSDKQRKIAEASGLDSRIDLLKNEIVNLENTIEQLEQEMTQPDKTISRPIIPYTIDLLNTISINQNVRLNNITPSKSQSNQDYETVIFSITVTGTYQKLFNWLEQIQQQLPKHVFQQFKIQAVEDGETCRLQLLLTHYQIRK